MSTSCSYFCFKMKISHFFSILVTLIFCTIYIAPVDSQIQCLEDQKTLLLKFKDELSFDSSASKKLVSWNKGNCCSWEGVGCDSQGHVISLELDNESIFDGLENSTSLFSLQYLQKLNLAFNNFDTIQIPRRLSDLTYLTHLNLSQTGISGQIPFELSTLKRLIVLDLSTLWQSNLKLENPGLGRLFQNLTKLQQLYLDGLNLSANGRDWCQILSSSLPNLRVLSLVNCYLSGPIHSSLSQLHSLSVLLLDSNDISSTVPNFFANFSSLTTLSLRFCSLQGPFPNKIFRLTKLRNLDLSNNELLSGTLLQFLKVSSLSTMVLSHTNFSGSLPDSIGDIPMLSRIELSNCKFTGKIPSTITDLTELIYLDLSHNNFTDFIPLFHMSKKLTYLDLSYNQLIGPLTSTHFDGLSSLEYIDLGDNFLIGNLPSPVFLLPSLQHFRISNNQFSGQIKELPNLLSSQLNMLDLSKNNLEGPVPKFFFRFQNLREFLLPFNFFNGTFDLYSIRGFHNLTVLDLSYNNLSVYSSKSNSTPSVFPRVGILNLASCKLQEFPKLLQQLKLSSLDLSANQLKGEIPSWIWEIVTTRTREYLNLSFNHLNGLQKPYNIPPIRVVDLSSNELHTDLPIPPYSEYLDISNNSFNNTIPLDIGNYIFNNVFLSLSSNRFTGVIPKSICDASKLVVLDLSNNALMGSIPSCLAENNGGSLGILNLQRNKLSGNIPSTFSVNCSLKTLDLSQNFLIGKIPVAMGNCPFLEVLNVGNNRIEDTFPCMLKNTSLRVLVLRSNRFHGELRCPGAIQLGTNLQIIDISVNNFTGNLYTLNFSKWKGMVNFHDSYQLRQDDVISDLINGFGYRDTVTLIIKGNELELKKILTVFTSIDLSSNRLNGELPDAIGDLKSLYLLNLSSNAFTGAIPKTIGYLRQLGSLDLSRNHFSGKIPEELSRLTFLSVLNLSFNNLSSSIPSGPQLQTFSETSYIGNAGLCGFPLSISCSADKVDDVPPQISESENLNGKTEIDWEYVCASLGFATGLGICVLTLLFCPKWREKYFYQVDRVLLKIFQEKRVRKRSTRTRVPR